MFPIIALPPVTLPMPIPNNGVLLNKLNTTLDVLDHSLAHHISTTGDAHSIKGIVSKIKPHAKDADINIKLSIALSSTLNATNYIIAAIESGSADPLSTAKYSMQAISSVGGLIGLVPLPGFAVGGAVFAAVTGIIASIISSIGTGEPPKSMEDILDELLYKHAGLQVLQDMKSAVQIIDGASVNLGGSEKKFTLDDVFQVYNFVSGIGAYHLASAEGWLTDPKNQQLPVWDDVFNEYVELIVNHLRILVDIGTRHLEEPETPGELTDDLGRMLASTWWTYQELARLWKELAPIAANRGDMYHIGTRKLYQRNHVIGSGEFWPEGTKLGGESEEIAVSAKTKRIWTLERSETRASPHKKEYNANGKIWTGFAGREWTPYPGLDKAVDMSLCSGTGDREDILAVTKRNGQVHIYKFTESNQQAILSATLPKPPEIKTVYQAKVMLVFPYDPANPGEPPVAKYRIYTLEERTAGGDDPIQISYYDIPTTGNFTPSARHVIVFPNVNNIVNLIGISVNRSMLIAYNSRNIWCTPHHVPTADHNISWPRLDQIDPRVEGVIVDAFACADESVIVAVGSNEKGGQPVVWDSYTRKWNYSSGGDGELKKIFKLPGLGNPMFTALYEDITASLDTFKYGAQYATLRERLVRTSLLNPMTLVINPHPY
jgi:hypothetical protein